jgi:hypothetical protein
LTDTAARPGWYDDPENRAHLRWWDGMTWSEHRKLNAGSGIREAADAASESPSQPGGRMRYADRERHMRRNNPFAYVAMLLALIGLIYDFFALPGLVAVGFAIAGIVRGTSLDGRLHRYRGITTAVVAMVVGVAVSILFVVSVARALH